MDKEKELLIGSMSDIAVRNLAAYTDNRIALIEDLQNLSSYGAVRTGIVVITLCLKGKASLYLNGDSYAMYPNDLLICHPNIIVEKSMVSVDVDFRCICLSPEYVHQLTIIDNNSWDVMKFLENTPILSLKSEEVQLFCQYYDLIRSKLTGTPCRHQKEVIDALLQAFMYEFHDSLERFIKLNPPTYSSGERLFKNFVNLLTSSYPKQRRVDFYAEQLHVTPKYLSSVCKQLCGQTPSTLIDQYVMRDVQYLLKKTDKSIKEISNELDFPNLSFFGKFVKKQTGLSPKFYREQNWNE